MIRLVLSGWYGNGNLGDEAILASMLQALRNRMPDLDITVFSDDPANTRSERCVDSFYHPPFPLDLQSLPTLIASRKEIRLSLAALKHAALFILGGGGLLHDYRGALYPWLLEVVLAKALGTPVALYALGVGPIRRKPGILLTQAVLSKADLITVRDPDSKELLQRIGVRSPDIEVTADPSVLLSPAPVVNIRSVPAKVFRRSEDIPLIGISLRPWFPYTVKDQKLAHEKESHLKMTLAQTADALIDRLGARIVFIPMHFGDRAGDASLCEGVLALMKSSNQAYLLSERCTPQQMMTLLGEMDIVIGMRLHSLILAAIMNVPVIGIAYDPKIMGFVSSINQEKYAINIEDLHVEHCLSLVKSVWLHRDQIRREIQERVTRLKQKALWNVQLICKMLELDER
jgi:polysaccharide pyruvyl transferase CsaB